VLQSAGFFFSFTKIEKLLNIILNMKAFLQHIVTDLKNFSKSLDTKSILVDKPWALIDSDFEVQKLIFKKNNQLILSKNGQVVIGSWDYFPEARSILIDRVQDKILCNEGFIDEGVMILKMDGTKNNFFVLANENIVPDLDAFKYLKQLRYVYLKISPRKLINGQVLEISDWQISDISEISKRVTIDAEEIEDGIYVDESQSKYIVKNGRVIEKITAAKYKSRDGLEILIEQKFPYFFNKGDIVWINGRIAPDGKYKILDANNIVVKDGKIVKTGLFT